MTTEPFRQVVEAYVQAYGYAGDDRVRAVFLVGSTASGKEDAYSDIDVMVAVNAMIPNEERLERLRAIGCRKIMLAIAGLDNPALPVQSQVIDKFTFQDVWFDVSYHLPDQLEFCFDHVTLVDKDNLTPLLCAPDQSYTEEQLKARAQTDLRLLHARIIRYQKYIHRREWIGLDLSAIKNLIVDLVMLVNGHPNYNRHSSRISQLLDQQPVKPEHFTEHMLDVLHLDNRHDWQRKIDLLEHMEGELTRLCEARWGPIPRFDD